MLLSTVPEALASKGREDREVRIVFVQGDVRISRGHDRHPDLNQPWEQVQDGEFVEQGCALATGDGRAEIEFENGSTVYLAENSVLLFRDLSSRAPGEIDVDVEDVLAMFLAKSHLSQLKELLSPSDRIVSGVTLATGTATFALQPAANEYFVIETPTDTMHLTREFLCAC